MKNGYYWAMMRGSDKLEIVEITHAETKIPDVRRIYEGITYNVDEFRIIEPVRPPSEWHQ